VTPERPTRVPPVDLRAPNAHVAFTDLVREYDDRLRALAYRLLGDRHRMDDVLQDAYVKAFRAMPGFKGDADIGTWLYRIVYNACLDDLRRESRHPTEQLAEDTEPQTGFGGIVGDDAGDRLSDRSSLADAFDELAEDQKAVVWLVDVEGFDYVAAANVLGVAAGTVGSRLSRAHKQLRWRLQQSEREGQAERGDGEP